MNYNIYNAVFFIVCAPNSLGVCGGLLSSSLTGFGGGLGVKSSGVKFSMSARL